MSIFVVWAVAAISISSGCVGDCKVNHEITAKKGSYGIIYWRKKDFKKNRENIFVHKAMIAISKKNGIEVGGNGSLELGKPQK